MNDNEATDRREHDLAAWLNVRGKSYLCRTDPDDLAEHFVFFDEANAVFHSVRSTKETGGRRTITEWREIPLGHSEFTLHDSHTGREVRETTVGGERNQRQIRDELCAQGYVEMVRFGRRVFRVAISGTPDPAALGRIASELISGKHSPDSRCRPG